MSDAQEAQPSYVLLSDNENYQGVPLDDKPNDPANRVWTSMMSYLVKVKRLSRLRPIFSYALCILSAIILLGRQSFYYFLISTPEMHWSTVAKCTNGSAIIAFILAVALQIPSLVNINHTQFSGTLGRGTWKWRCSILSLVIGYVGIIILTVPLFGVAGIGGVIVLVMSAATNWWDVYSRWIIPSDVLNQHNSLASVYLSDEPWLPSDTKDEIDPYKRRDIWKFAATGGNGECQMIKIKQAKSSPFDAVGPDGRATIELEDVHKIEVEDLSSLLSFDTKALVLLAANWTGSIVAGLVLIILCGIDRTAM